MRVVLVTPHWPPRASGHGDYSWHLTHSLREAGADISVLVLGQDDVDESIDSAISVTGIDFPDSPKRMRAVVKAVAALRPDVVCLQFEANAYRLKAFPHLLPAALRMKGLRVVLMYHELWAPSRLGRPAKFALLNAPSRVVAFSQWHAQGMHRFRKIGPPVDIIAVATNILRPELGDLRLHKTRYGFTADETVISFFGFIVPEHRLHNLLSAVGAARERVPGLRLSVIGGFDPDRNSYHQSLEAQTRELGISSVTTWHGRVQDPQAVARLLGITDIGVLPYDTGVGENNGAFVAMAQYGFPIVTTTGARSALMEAENVAKFVSEDVAEIENAIVELCQDHAQATALGERAAAWSERRTWDKLAGAFMETFDPDSGVVNVE